MWSSGEAEVFEQTSFSVLLQCRSKALGSNQRIKSLTTRNQMRENEEDGTQPRNARISTSSGANAVVLGWPVLRARLITDGAAWL